MVRLLTGALRPGSSRLALCTTQNSWGGTMTPPRGGLWTTMKTLKTPCVAMVLGLFGVYRNVNPSKKILLNFAKSIEKKKKKW